jgi:hypothetical protein
MLAARLAPVGHWLVVFALGHIKRTTVAAMRLTSPTTCLKNVARSILIWEFLEELECAKCV